MDGSGRKYVDFKSIPAKKKSQTRIKKTHAFCLYAQASFRISQMQKVKDYLLRFVFGADGLVNALCAANVIDL